ncbi:diaminopimelate decarboxylase [Microbacterium sp. cx-55]|uniref:diaminopimelate decarboxylase n=1 Tax=unclassified Microbacterium TaxID=2609290 RepID=UPI001CBC7518|nr:MULTISPECIES: diaminopimelate decarboxylase [unclassified Microbacterium]MBZ4488506.1 diaminopimelate decarboxylase [Microbacterium sp. cx-55]MCC4909649.1 diaminopimelate decarboxylase [Microbacterium sp. cx-59]UGB36092.1 diaminopimelate decarboxylase [Microbacterium sp. cx-55]
MSASSSRPVVPAWLEVPTDPNDLAAGVWPHSSRRRPEGELEIAGVSVGELAATYGTPLYVLDEDEVRTRARRTRAAFEAAAARHGTEARVYYAGKAFLSTEVVRWVMGEGLTVDVCSAGELAVALAGGASPDRLGYHGNNKSAAQLRRAVDIGIGSIVVDSLDEISRLAQITAGRQSGQPVLIRVNTGIHAETHDFLATAHEDQKFGFSPDAARVAAARVREVPGLELIGLHCHIGSQIFGAAGFAASAERLVALHAELLAGGDLPVLNLGGGFGIAYTRVDEPAVIEELADAIVDAVAAACAAHGIALPRLAFEPGRSIVGPAGVTLYEIGTVKPVALGGDTTRTYVSVDGGMSDNARPALYGAQYSARLASRAGAGDPELVRVVGSHCESGDIVVDAEYLPGDVAPGDLLAVPATGAYCFSLSSNYNYAPRPAVVAVREGRARVIVRGETVDDLLARDAGATVTKGEA